MDVNIGLLFVLAVTTIGIWTESSCGWSSNSKYSLIGGLGSAAQLISYEVPMGFAIAAVILMDRRSRSSRSSRRRSGWGSGSSSRA